MDDRTNNEIMDLAPNDVGMEMVHLENGDLFYTKALTIRQGVKDISHGIIGATGAPSILYNLQSNVPSGTTETLVGQLSHTVAGFPPVLDYYGLIIIPTGDTNIYSGTMTVRGTSPTPFVGDDLKLTMRLVKLDQAAFPASGISFMSGTSASPKNVLHDIALSGNANQPPFPQYNPSTLFVNQIPTPLAIAGPTIFNVGTYNPSGGNFYTDFVEVPYKFNAPYLMTSGNVYFLQNFIETIPNNKPARAFEIKTISQFSNDFYPNLSLAQTFFFTGPPAQIDAVRWNTVPKQWLEGDIYKYNEANYMLIDNPTASYDYSAPLFSGTYLSSPDVPFEFQKPTPIPFKPFNGLTTVPTVSTTSTEFGQIITIPSGEHAIYGAYFYANTFSGFTTSGATINNYTRNKTNYNPNNYNVGYYSKLYQINAASGTMSGNTYTTTSLTPLAFFSGSHIFNTSIDQPSSNIQDPNYNLERLYAFYNIPAVVNVTSGTDFLLSFGFYDIATGNALTDYANYSSDPYWYFLSPMKIGMENNIFSGSFVYNKNLDGKTFQQLNSNAGGGPAKDLTCGLISVPSGNAVTSIYDYRVGDNRSQRVMLTERNEMRFFELGDPTNQTTIFSGGAIGDNFKWQHSTFQNLLISHQYSQISGVVWDQIYSNPSGNWTQLHGLRPVFSGAGHVLPSGSIPSGATVFPTNPNFDIVLGTSILTGGIRSSEVLTISGTNFASGSNSVQLFGVASSSNDATFPYDIYHVSGVAASGQSQYKFDVFSNGTYVFTTQNSGITYFAADLCDSNGNPYPNPLPNNNTWNLVPPYYSGAGTTPGSGVFIFDINYSGINAQQVPNIINNGQTYLLNQIDVPKFKKTLVWNNLLLGIGDPNNPSRIWFSQIGAPEIFGSVGDINYGFYDVDPDNGQVITGIENYKGYLIIFKENSTYSAQYTSTAGNPMVIQQIDPNKGNLGIFATVSTPYGVFGLSQYGPVLATYYGCETIGDEILPYYQSLSHRDLIFSVAIHDTARQQIYWSTTNSEEIQDSQTGLVYSYALKAWNIRRNGIWNCAGTIGDADNFALLYVGDTLGQIKQINSGVYSDDILFIDVDGIQFNKSVTLEFETPWMNFGGNSQDLKQAKSLRVNCENSDQTLKIDVYYDQNDTAPAYSRYLDMSQPVNNRVVSLAGVFRTMKLVVSSFGRADKVKINSMMLTYMNRGQNTNIS
jgi:hypothetical protein